MAAENVRILVEYNDCIIFYSKEDFETWFYSTYGKRIYVPPEKYPAALIGGKMVRQHDNRSWYKGNFVYDYEV